MNFRSGIYRARGHLIFLLGLLVSFSIILALEGVEAEQARSAAGRPEPTQMQAMLEAAGQAPVAQPLPLSPDQVAWAQLAWRYFEQNVHPETGLPGSVDRFFGVTAWEIGSYLNALVSAQRLGLITPGAFDDYMVRALDSIGKLPLYAGSLPNKSYDVRSLKMTDYNGEPTEDGIGWSALDLARLLIAMEIVEAGYPEHAEKIAAIEKGWRIDAMLLNGVMVGRLPTNPEPVQEGRLGYEEYAAKGLVRLGLDAYRALEVADTVHFVDAMGVLVPVDDRHAEQFDAEVCTTSEPYVLEGLEMGFDARSRASAWAVLRAQQARARATGLPTALSEGHVPGAPYFVYGCVVGNGVPWAVLSPQGERFDQLRFLDTKSVFGWSALMPNEYTSGLLSQIFPLNDPERGWFTGRFEADGATNGTITANTNAIILESLHFRAFGPLLTFPGRARS
ncbi:DUF3131 domain-containing protein [Geminicoccus roseus]|uniref:DUF3131 domain-containing protein n=1 Tax=Geminicoccus roseus TaxID=404900 RepID=UPI0004243C76|nr:DUF3131 domain-containing protein [Geminicoccus roseus]